MKDILKKTLSASICTLCFVFLASSAIAQSSLRTNDSVVIDNAYVTSITVLTDPKGLIYTEFAEKTYIVHRETKGRFTGEILPPTIIEEAPYTKNPRGRMREIVAFEVASDSLEDLYFVDKFDVAHQRNRQRAAILNGGTLERTKLVKVLIPLFKEYGSPALWEYTGEQDDPWIRLGGRQENTKENDIQLFVASLTGTGIYVLFDEDPAPDNADTFIPYEEIQTAPTAPYTSVQPTFDILENTPADTFVGDDLFDFNPDGPVNVPVDQFGNPIEELSTNQPFNSSVISSPAAFDFSGNDLNGFGISQAKLDANRESIQPLFPAQTPVGINTNTSSSIPTTSSTNPLNPPLNQEIATPTNNLFTTETPSSTQVISSERVNELVRQRLLQTTPESNDLINPRTRNEVPTNASDALLKESNTTPEYSDARSALLSDTIQTQNISLSETTDSSITNTLLTEEALENDSYSSAPDGDLPKTGRNKNNILWYIMLLGLIGIGAFVWHKKRSPQQMRIKMK